MAEIAMDELFLIDAVLNLKNILLNACQPYFELHLTRLRCGK